MRRRLLLVSSITVVVLVAAACGDDASPTTTPGPDGIDLPDDVVEDPDGAIEDATDDLDALQEAEGGGSATLVVGGETWEFDSVLCGFGPEETGQEGMTFAMVSTRDGLQLNAQVTDDFGDSITFIDVENFREPSVSYSASSIMNEVIGGPAQFIEIDGTNVSASTPFSDETADPADGLGGLDGTLTVDCP